MKKPTSVMRFTTGAAAVTLCSPAVAHHPIGGEAPTTMVDGLLSGLGHPVIEPVHLLFLLGAATLVGLTRVPLRTAMALLVLHVLAASLATAIASGAGMAPALHLALAGSLLALVPPLWQRRFPGAGLAGALAAAGGLVHGLAFSETIVGAEVTPMFAYLAGLAMVQSGMLVLACAAVRLGLRRHPLGASRGSRALAGSLLAAGIVIALTGA